MLLFKEPQLLPTKFVFFDFPLFSFDTCRAFPQSIVSSTFGIRIWIIWIAGSVWSGAADVVFS
jgi:hypothetical protein